MSIAVSKVSGMVDVYTDSVNFSVDIKDFNTIRTEFSQKHILMQDLVIRPNAVINYLEESNPYLLEAEIQIENNKIRREMANPAYDMAKIAIPFAIIIIAGVVAWKMLTSGDVASAAHTVSSVTSAPPVLIK